MNTGFITRTAITILLAASKSVKADGPNAAPCLPKTLPDTVATIPTAAFGLTSNGTAAPGLVPANQLMSLVLGIQPPQTQEFNHQLVTGLANQGGAFILGGAGNISYNCGLPGAADCADLNANCTVLASSVLSTASAKGITVTLAQNPKADVNNLLDRVYMGGALQTALDGVIAKNSPPTLGAKIKEHIIPIAGAAGGAAVLGLVAGIVCCVKRNSRKNRQNQADAQAASNPQPFYQNNYMGQGAFEMMPPTPKPNGGWAYPPAYFPNQA